MTDPIADLLTRIRNALMVRHASLLVPVSTMKVAILRMLKEEGYIRDYEVIRGTRNQRVIRVHMLYDEQGKPVITNLKRISKPGLRIYSVRKEIPRPYGGLGIAVLSTSKGVMTGRQAWQQGVGGEVLCYVW